MCDSSNFTNVSASVVPTGTTPIFGNQTFSQVWRDELTGMLFTNVLYSGGGTTTWSEAVRLCEDINGSSAGTGWRLPTQKELMQLYIDGVAKLSIAGGTTSNFFWTSSADSNATNNSWILYLSYGSTGIFTTRTNT